MRLLPVIGVLLGLGWFFSSSAEEVIGGIPPFYTTVQGEKLIGWMYVGRSTRVLILSKSRRNGCSGLVLNARILSRFEPERCFLLFWFSGVTEKGVSYRAFFPLGGTMYDFLMFDRVQFYLLAALCNCFCERSKKSDDFMAALHANARAR